MVTPGSDWKIEIGTLIGADTFMGVDFQGCPDDLQIRGPDSAMMVKFCPW